MRSLMVHLAIGFSKLQPVERSLWCKVGVTIGGASLLVELSRKKIE